MTARVLPFARPAEQAPSEPLDDRALVAACAAGHRAALGPLFDRHHHAVQRFLAHTAGVDEAADCVQTTFVRVLEAAPRFRGDASVRSWILGIAANVARNHIRSDVRRKRLLTRLFERPDPTPRAVERLERRQLVARLPEALAALPHDLRVAFVMCHVEGVPGVEAARALGVRPGTLYRRLHDARARLRAALGERPDLEAP